MMRRRAAQEDEARRAAQYQAYKPKSALGHGTSTVAKRPAVNSETTSNPMDRQLQFDQRMAEMAKLRALTSPPPMKAVTGFNQIGSASGQDVLDPSQMNAFQRQAYLPSGSSDVTPGNTRAPGSFGQPQQPTGPAPGSWDAMSDAERIRRLTGSYGLSRG
jgi:hypothetical protein